MGSEKTEPWHKPMNGSVFPAQTRTVKRMMYEKMKQVVKDCIQPTTNKGSKTVSPAPEASKSNHD